MINKECPDESGNGEKNEKVEGQTTYLAELRLDGHVHRPAAYWLSQTANAVWTLFIAWVLWSDTFFTPPIIPD